MSPTRSPDGRRRHIVAINNDAMVLGLFRDLLEDEGYRVTTQTYLDKDLAALAQLAPDLIILDYMWAEEDNGWSYLQMLRMNPSTATIPIVLCTGAVREVEALASHLDDMAVQVVLKPFNIDRLVDVIAAALSSEAAPAAEP
jgi:CheY-like chemotaxis protein